MLPLDRKRPRLKEHSNILHRVVIRLAYPAVSQVIPVGTELERAHLEVLRSTSFLPGVRKDKQKNTTIYH